MMDFRGLLFNESWAARVELGEKLRPFGTGGGHRRMASEEAIRAASEEVSQQFKTLINTEEVESIKQTQHLILGRLQDSNAVLSHFNEYSERCFTEVSGDFSRNTRFLKSMKSDLDYIFMKLRSMKSRLKGMYPDAFPDDSTSKILDQRPDLEKPLPFRE